MADPKTDIGFRQHVLEGRYSVFGQTIFDIQTLEPLHDEWLVRFDVDEKLEGLLRPAEISGAISDLDISMLAQAIKTLNIDKRRRPIAVNLSGASMASPNFEARLFAALDNLTTKPARLILELTETWNLNKLKPVEDILAQLSARGHPLCLDDVGAGAASIRYLRAFKTQWLKIDGEFVHDAFKSARQAAILRAVLSLKAALNVKFIAEGVETQEIFDFAKSEGFDAAQGYFLSKPELEPIRRL